MHGEQSDTNPALTELRRRLADRLAQSGLTQTQLAARASLGRTTVSEAFSPTKGVPSAATVAVIAKALKLPMEELLELQRAAAGKPGSEASGGVGRPILDWDPHALEVHPAASGSGPTEARGLSGYVRRPHDDVLDDAVRDVLNGRSRIVVLVGTSSTGKTRACWEAVRRLAEGEPQWRLWHPYDPSRAEAALADLQNVGPHTVVWLNEAQHYLGKRAVGERIAAAVHRLLQSRERKPVLVLGTLWPEYARQYTALPTEKGKDPHSRVRELLSGHTVIVPDAFTPQDLAAAAVLAEQGDRLLSGALTRARTDGRVAQDLAGAPELLNRYETASPAAKAILEAAMDALRLGVGPHLPHAFLSIAAHDYLTDTDRGRLTRNWAFAAAAAFAELAEPVHGNQAPLNRTAPSSSQRPPASTKVPEPATVAGDEEQLRLADYLEQHGRNSRSCLCPPASFWHAAAIHLTRPEDLHNLCYAARQRHRQQWAHHLLLRAVEHSDARALVRWGAWWEGAGDGEAGERLLRQAAERDTHALVLLAWRREAAGDMEAAKRLRWQAAERGDTHALTELVWRLMWRNKPAAGDWEAAERLLRQAAERGNTDALVQLARRRRAAGDGEAAEDLLRQAAERGNTDALTELARQREEAGDGEAAEDLLRQAAERGDAYALTELARRREEAGDWEAGERLAGQAAERGRAYALTELARRREKAGDMEAAERLAGQAAERGNTDALTELARRREKAGDMEAAERLAGQAADHGNTEILVELARRQEDAGDGEAGERLLRQAAERGDTEVLVELARRREEAGDWEAAERLAGQAADHGNTQALVRLARRLGLVGDGEAAERLLRQAAERGYMDALAELAWRQEEAGNGEAAERLAGQAANGGNTDALLRLARRREAVGDGEAAERLAGQAADHGDIEVLVELARRREKTGDREAAERLAGQAANRGIDIRHPAIELLGRLWPFGLDPDGTPTPPWQ